MHGRHQRRVRHLSGRRTVLSSDTKQSVTPGAAASVAPFRVLVAKIGMDGHDRGARVVARALRDAGMEVIYTGRHVSVDFIARSAVEEDVDVVGLSILAGAHVPLTQLLLDALDKLGARGEVEIVVGGTISTEQTKNDLLALGVADVFPGATPLAQVVERVARAAEQRRARDGG